MPRAKPLPEKALDAVLRGLDIVPPDQRHDVLAHAKRILDRERKRGARAATAPEPETPPADATQRQFEDLDKVTSPTHVADPEEAPS